MIFQGKFDKKRGALLCGILAAVLAVGAQLPAVRTLIETPEQLVMTMGQSVTLAGNGLTLSKESAREEEAVLSLHPSGNGAGGSVKACAPGTENVVIRAGGLPVKKVSVTVNAPRTVALGGDVVGVALYTRGALVVSFSDVPDEHGNLRNPAREAGLLPGDILLSVNGSRIDSALHFSKLLCGVSEDRVTIGFERDQKRYEATAVPVKGPGEDVPRLGMWLRDSTAGVGTLTFADESSGWYGALGHGVTDSQTGAYLTVSSGEIYKANLLGVIKGEPGTPGELVGDFFTHPVLYGSLRKNGPYGIFGEAAEELMRRVETRKVPIGSADSVHVGAAQIVTTVSGSEPRAYDCEIVRAARQKRPNVKSMVIRVTDPELLALTGGIVQGMSGSPILQDGFLIGAVTHVLVNDPGRGYGMYIDWMLDQLPEGEGSE